MSFCFQPTEVKFFAATTLYTKIEKSLSELNPEQIVALKERLLSGVITYSAGPKMVLNKLCSCVSSMRLFQQIYI